MQNAISSESANYEINWPAKCEMALEFYFFHRFFVSHEDTIKSILISIS